MLSFEDLKDAPAPLTLYPTGKGFNWVILILCIPYICYITFVRPFDHSIIGKGANSSEVSGTVAIIWNIIQLIFFGGFAFSSALHLFFGKKRLILTNERFTYFSLFGNKVYHWKNTGPFSETDNLNCISFRYEGEDKFLDNNYSFIGTDFAKLMNHWRERVIFDGSR